MRSSFPQYIKSSQLKALKLEECNSIGRQIAYYRVNQDMTMQMLADKCELSKSVIEKAEFEDCVTLENIEKIEKALNITGKLYREPYYVFLKDNPVEKIEKFVRDNKMMWKDFSKLTNLDKHTINGWRYRSKVIAKRSFEKLQRAGVV